MAKEQILREQYEYTLSDSEFKEYERSVKKSSLIFAIPSLVITVLLFVSIFFSNDFTVNIVLCILFGAFSFIFFKNYINNCKIFKNKSENGASYKLRFYDDFLVFEVSNNDGIEALATSRLEKIVITGRGKELLLIGNGLYVIPVRKSLIDPSSFLGKLMNAGGSKFRSTPDTPMSFIEQRAAFEEREVTPKEINDSEDNETESTAAEDEAESEASEESTEQSYNACRDDRTDSPYLFEAVFNAKAPNFRFWRMLGRLFSLLSFFSIFGAAFTALDLTASGKSAYVSLLFLIIPLALLTIGIIRMRKRVGGLGNVITAAFTVIFIIFAVIGENTAPSEEDIAEANEYLSYVEETVSIDLPEFDLIEYDVYDDGSKNIYVYISDDEKIEELHAYFAQEAKFFKTAPSSYLGLLPVYSRSNDQDFGLIYNVTTGETNTMPKSDGSYTMIYIDFYDYRDGTAALYVEEYVIDYASDFSK